MKGQPPGEANANAKLTDDIVRDVFTADGTDAQIAADRGLGRSVVYRIRAHLSWTHITKDLKRGKTVRRVRTPEETRRHFADKMPPDDVLAERIKAAVKLQDKSWPRSFMDHPQRQALLG